MSDNPTVADVEDTLADKPDEYIVESVGADGVELSEPPTVPCLKLIDTTNEATVVVTLDSIFDVEQKYGTYKYEAHFHRTGTVSGSPQGIGVDRSWYFDEVELVFETPP